MKSLWVVYLKSYCPLELCCNEMCILIPYAVCLCSIHLQGTAVWHFYNDITFTALQIH
jgi:hypothetical protein